jgi:hypothetical protein
VNVWAYRLLGPSEKIDPWQLCAIKSLTKQRDLYTTFEGDQEGDDFEKVITREIEEPGQAAIEKVIDNFKMKPAGWYPSRSSLPRSRCERRCSLSNGCAESTRTC